MLVEVKTLDEGVVKRLTDIYAESMDALEKHFPSRERMLAEYAAFAADFARQENQRILAEDAGNGWVSALRAIEAQPGSWFLEAVETMPSQRGKGHGTGPGAGHPAVSGGSGRPGGDLHHRSEQCRIPDHARVLRLCENRPAAGQSLGRNGGWLPAVPFPHGSLTAAGGSRKNTVSMTGSLTA